MQERLELLENSSYQMIDIRVEVNCHNWPIIGYTMSGVLMCEQAWTEALERGFRAGSKALRHSLNRW